MGKQTRQEQFWDDLAAVVDGEPDAVDAYADLLAASSEHRDARFEAEHAARRLAEAGDDWEPAEDLEDRLVALMEAEPVVSPETSDAAPASDALTPAADAPSNEPDETKRPHESASPAARRPALMRPRRGNVIWLAGIAAAAAVALAFVGASLLSDDDGAAPEAAESGLLSARVAQIARAADDGVPGLEVRLAGAEGFVPALAGTEVTPGATFRTDDRTRAELALSDGSVLVLNHGTEIGLSAETARQISLTHGEIVADVAHLEQGPRAEFVTPAGSVEVLGTKLMVTATDEATSVRVTRGAVMIHPRSGPAVDVKAGEEGVLSKSGPATVTPAMHLADAVEWSELTGPSDTSGGIRGLGELRARRPGERQDQERPLTLSEQKVDVRIVGNVARTEIEQTFRNDGPHTLEGIYRFPLPSDARIASLALDVDGEWQQGAFVSRDRAQKIWRGVIRNATPVAQRERNEEFIWVPGPWRDPALLEWQRGSQFELRIFPIPARGERRIRLAYTQNVAPSGTGRRYVYPLPHSGDDSTRVGRMQATVRVAGADADTPPEARGYAMSRALDDGATRLAFEAQDFVPAGDLVVDYRLADEDAEIRWWTYAGQATVPGAESSREGEPDVAEEQRQIHADGRGYVVFAVRPELPAWGRGEAKDYVLVLDSSQSMVGERWSRASELAVRLVTEMDRRDRVMVLACDAECQSFDAAPALPSADIGRRLERWLSELRPAGSSDLIEALRAGAVALEGKRQPDRSVHVIYVGDGMASVGHRRPSSVSAEVSALATDPRLSFSTVGVGGDADALMLGAVARAGGGHHVPYVPGQRIGAAALAILETTFGAALTDATLELPEGVTDVAPARLPTIRAGEEVILVGRLPEGTAEVRGNVVLTGRVGDRPFEDRYPVTLTATTAAGNAFVPQEWAARTIDELELAGKPAQQPRIVALSKAFGVMSRHTSLLVLESEAMFRAFGVDRAQAAAQWTGEGEMVQGQSEGLRAQRQPTLDGNIAGALASVSATGGTGTRRARRSSRGRGTVDVRLGDLAQSGYDFGGNYWNDELGAYRQPAGTAGVAGGTIRAGGHTVRMQENEEDGEVASLDDRVGGGETVVTATPRPVLPRPVSLPRDRAQTTASPDADRTDAAPQTEAQAPPPPTRRPGGGQWMRRVWYSVGRIVADDDVREIDRRRAQEAEAALSESPDSRDRHRALARSLARSGDVERAIAAVEKWITRDQLDPEALTLLSDLVGRNGDRAAAIRLLSGIVDLRPDDEALQGRLVAAFERAGMDARACSHRVALAELSPADADAVGAAVRCERALHRDASAQRLLDSVSDTTVRDEAARIASEPLSRERLRGSITLDASWAGASDVDLTLITPQGTRLSFLGGHSSITAVDASAIGHEGLGLGRARSGSYILEVSRADATDDAPISGTVRVQVVGERTTVPFRLDAEGRQVIARVEIERRSRVVPMP